MREKSKPVQIDDSIQELASSMLSALSDFGGIGLAAIQVGFPYRMFVVDTHQKGERLVFINPEIISSSEDRVAYNEGCLSVPGSYADVYRPSQVTILSQDISGKRFQLNATGLLARVIQHEYDHLNGVLFTDRLEEAEENRVKNEALANIKKIKKGKK